eukprot:TRINITY_DN2725_c0_g2_i1.p1 TRINITY_DN2725_c0_g2~~TRINITY_DN2725_c0_g2_i1.p1  ORF type:complete len:124 (+),score=25.41 TRINITY_DN2725_c0_g2_i1:51-422(+)
MSLLTALRPCVRLSLTRCITTAPTVAPKQVQLRTFPLQDAPHSHAFHVSRTAYGKGLPIYTEFRNGGTRKLTVIRRLSGDVDAFVQEMQKVIGPVKVEKKIGSLVVTGLRSREIKLWLSSLGF